MGSISYPTPLNARDSIREYMHNNLREDHTIVASTVAPTGRHWKEDFTTVGYFAVDDGQDVTAHIILGMKYQGDVIIKALHENLLTAHTGMTAKVLNALTPTDNECALEWRERSRNYINRRAQAHKVLRHAQKTGSVVTLAQPISYNQVGDVNEVCIDADGTWLTTDRAHRLRKPTHAWTKIAV